MEEYSYYDESNDIDDRMARYAEVYEIENAEINYFDPIKYLTQLTDMMNDKNYDIFICEREIQCKCKKECNCDSDECAQVNKIDNQDGSNCNYIITMSIDHVFSKKKPLRIFRMNKYTDEEEALFDIITLKNGKKIVFDNIAFLHEPKTVFEIDEFTMDEHYILLKFNYMNSL